MVLDKMSVSVSVIITAFSIERAKTIKLCIDSMKSQTLPPLEVILVLDPVESIIAFYRNFIPSYVHIVVSTGFGMSNARNSAIKVAKGDVVAFIDDDAFASKDWVERIVSDYEDPNVIGVGGAIKPLWESSNPVWLPEELYWIVGCSYRGLPNNKQSVRNPIGANMSFRRRIFQKVGFFNTPFLIGRNAHFHNLLGAEEAQFSLRALRKIEFSKIIYDPAIIVNHLVPMRRLSIKYLITRAYREGYSKAAVSKLLKSYDVLSTERAYIKRLLLVSVPGRISKIDAKNFVQLFVLFVSASSVFLGYLVGKIVCQKKS